MRRPIWLCLALLMLLALSASSSSAAAPDVVAGKAEGQCGTDSRAQLDAAPVAAGEATFNGSSPLLTLAVGDAGGLYVGDTVAVRQIAEGRVSTVLGRMPATTEPSSSPVGLGPGEADVTVSGLAAAGSELYFVHRAGTQAAPTIQVLSVALDDPDARIRARSAAAPAGAGPHGLAVDGSGTLYVADSPNGASGRLGRLQPGQPIEWIPVPVPIESVAVDAAGDRAYVAGQSERMYEVDLAGTPPRAAPIGSQLSRSSTKRVALDRAGGMLFLADGGAGTLEQIDLRRPQEPRPLAGGEADEPAVFAVGMGFGRDSAQAPRRLFVLDSTHCAVLSLTPLPAASGPTSSPGSTAVPASGGEDRQTTQLTTPGARASDTEAVSGGPAAGERVESSLADTGGSRLTAEDLVNQLLGGRSDGAFGGSQAITEEDLALLSAPGGRGEGVLGADLSGVAIEQAASSGSPPLPPPPPVVPSPGPEAIVSSAAAAPPAPVPAAPPQPAGAPPLAGGQVNPTPGWGGASSDAAEAAPRYAMVANDDGGPAAAAVLTGLLVVGGCSLVVAFGAAGRGRARREGQPARARAWAR